MRILLTATITPNAGRIPHVSDPDERREEYAARLRQWSEFAERHGATVVLYENSGADLGSLVVTALGSAPDHVRLHPAAPPHPATAARGKGAAEAAMMDAFADDYADDPAGEVWVKCTGRLFVRNADRCLPRLTDPGLAVRLSLDLAHADSRFFATTAGVWRSHLVGVGDHTDSAQGIYLEHAVARRTLAAVADGASLTRFRTQPDFLGRSGTFANRRYDSTSSRVKRWGAEGLERALRGPLKGKHF